MQVQNNYVSVSFQINEAHFGNILGLLKSSVTAGGDSQNMLRKESKVVCKSFCTFICIKSKNTLTCQCHHVKVGMSGILHLVWKQIQFG